MDSRIAEQLGLRVTSEAEELEEFEAAKSRGYVIHTGGGLACNAYDDWCRAQRKPQIDLVLLNDRACELIILMCDPGEDKKIYLKASECNQIVALLRPLHLSGRLRSYYSKRYHYVSPRLHVHGRVLDVMPRIVDIVQAAVTREVERIAREREQGNANV